MMGSSTVLVLVFVGFHTLGIAFRHGLTKTESLYKFNIARSPNCNRKHLCLSCKKPEYDNVDLSGGVKYRNVWAIRRKFIRLVLFEFETLLSFFYIFSFLKKFYPKQF
jgi:hypothetical protein